MLMHRRSKALAAAVALIAGPVAAEVNDAALAASRPPANLSEIGLFDDMAAMRPSATVVPYTISSPLYTDYALKYRFVYVPASAGPAAYQGEDVLDLPVGSVLVKTFAYPDGAGGIHRIETRLLIRQEAGWKAWPYVWNEEQNEAVLKVAGKDMALIATRPDGSTIEVAYHVPNVNQCKGCHVGTDGEFRPIGPKIRNLNLTEDGGNQLDRLVAAGIIAELPADRTSIPATPAYSDETVALEDRARAYLDANCGHCHAPGRPADTSGLYLNWEEDREIHRGIMKPPVAAGRGSGGFAYDIVPGDPDHSILLYRLDSTDPGIMMPELGRSTIDEAGVALIRAYIEALGS
jgi:uncharacterized repeat protein (TIGR03806 family)